MIFFHLQRGEVEGGGGKGCRGMGATFLTISISPFFASIS